MSAHRIPAIRGGSDRGRMPMRSNICIACIVVWCVLVPGSAVLVGAGLVALINSVLDALL